MKITSDIFSKHSAKKFLITQNYNPKGVINVKKSFSNNNVSITWKEYRKSIYMINTTVERMSEMLYNYDRLQKLKRILDE